MTYGLAIDLGSYSTSAAIARHETTELLQFHGSPCLPAVVYLDPAGQLIAGREAALRAARAPARAAVAPKRDVSAGQEAVYLGSSDGVSTAELMAATLRYVVVAATDSVGERPSRVVLTHPYRWRQWHKALLLLAAEHAELPAPELLSEPEAAAVYMRRSKTTAVSDSNGCLVVCDFGSDGVETSVVTSESRAVLANGRQDGFGGDDIDEAVLEIAREFHVDTRGSEGVGVGQGPDGIALRREANRVKEALSEPPYAAWFEVTEGIRYRISRGEDLRPAIEDRLKEVVKAIRAVVQRANLDDEDLSAVCLTGGSSAIPLVNTLVNQEFSTTVTVPHEHPKASVALGAALWLQEQEPRLRARDLCDEAEAHRRAGRHEEALAAAGGALDLRPGDARASKEKGLASRNLKKHEEAVPCLRHAAEVNRDPDTLASLADSLKMLDRYDDALAVLDEALLEAPDSRLALAVKGSVLRLTRQYEQALVPLQRAVELNPSYAFAQRELGTVLRLLGRYSAAHEALDAALAAEPNNAFAVGQKGRVFLAQKSSANAVEYLERARTLYGTNQSWIKESLRDAYLLGVEQRLYWARYWGGQGKSDKQEKELERAGTYSIKLIRLTSGFHRIDTKSKAERIPDEVLSKLNELYKKFTGKRLFFQDWLQYAEDGKDPVAVLVPRSSSWFFSKSRYNWLMWRTYYLF